MGTFIQFARSVMDYALVRRTTLGNLKVTGQLDGKNITTLPMILRLQNIYIQHIHDWKILVNASKDTR